MAIELKELIIKVKINEAPSTPASLNPNALAAIKREIIEECLERMRAWLENREER